MTNTKSNRPLPWERREDETAKAYLGFRCYMELGPKERSLAAAYKHYSGSDEAPKKAPGYFCKWSRENDWMNRVQACDELVAIDALEAREEARQRAYQELAGNALEAARVLVQIALGRLEAPDATVDEENQKVMIEVSASDRRLAASEVLDRVGVVTPKSVAGQLEGDEGLDRLPYEVRSAILRAMNDAMRADG